jgi:hypothetical protein
MILFLFVHQNQNYEKPTIQDPLEIIIKTQLIHQNLLADKSGNILFIIQETNYKQNSQKTRK